MSDSPTDPLVKVARDLRELVSLCGALEDQAVHKASDREMPGGDAMAMLAPVANLEAWQNRLSTQERLWSEGLAPEPFIDEPDFEPPLQTLLFWSEQWRVEHNRVSDLTPTVASEAAFLAGLMEWAWENEPHFDDMARDIAKARTKLENLLKDGERQMSGAPCLRCRRSLIRKTDAKTGGLTDHWRCPNPDCQREYDEQQYRNAVAAAYASLQIEHVDHLGYPSGLGYAEVWATVDRAAVEAARSHRTIRTWVTEGVVRRACLILGRREVVSVDDAKRESNTRKRRNRAA